MSKLIYNNQTGLFRDVEIDEDLSMLQDYEVIVNAKPKSSCPKCHGRGFIGRDIVRKELMMCRKCFRKITDFDHARERVKIQMEQLKAKKLVEDNIPATENPRVGNGDSVKTPEGKIDYLPADE